MLKSFPVSISSDSSGMLVPILIEDKLISIPSITLMAIRLMPFDVCLNVTQTTAVNAKDNIL
jgi:hypothetical protein